MYQDIMNGINFIKETMIMAKNGAKPIMDAQPT